MTLPFISDPFACVELTTRLLGLAEAVGAISKLANWRDYRRDGAQSWELLTITRARARNLPLARLILDYPGILALLAARGLAGLSLTLAPAEAGGTVALTIVVIASLALDWRHFGLNETASYRLQLIIAMALLLHCMAPTDPIVCDTALVFVATNAAGSYVFSAIVKLGDPEWRNGSKVFVVANSTFLGNRWLTRRLHGLPMCGRLLTWGVLAFELLLPLSIPAGPSFCAQFLAAGILFHFCNRILFKLPGFVLAYATSYPAILRVAELTNLTPT